METQKKRSQPASVQIESHQSFYNVLRPSALAPGRGRERTPALPLPVAPAIRKNSGGGSGAYQGASPPFFLRCLRQLLSSPRLRRGVGGQYLIVQVAQVYIHGKFSPTKANRPWMALFTVPGKEARGRLINEL